MNLLIKNFKTKKNFYRYPSDSKSFYNYFNGDKCEILIGFRCDLKEVDVEFERCSFTQIHN